MGQPSQTKAVPAKPKHMVSLDKSEIHGHNYHPLGLLLMAKYLSVVLMQTGTEIMGNMVFGENLMPYLVTTDKSLSGQCFMPRGLSYLATSLVLISPASRLEIILFSDFSFFFFFVFVHLLLFLFQWYFSLSFILQPFL